MQETQVMTSNDVQVVDNVVENLAQAETPEPAKPSLEDQAASNYASLVPVWDRFASNASKKSLIRVVKAATKWPLQDEAPKFQSEIELKAFQVLLMILDCKTIMVSSVLEERMKKGATSGEKENLA